MEVGDIVRYYINPNQYITGRVVEICEDNTVWVRHSNGQERNYPQDILRKHGSDTKIQNCSTCKSFCGEVGDGKQFCDELETNVDEKWWCNKFSWKQDIS